VFGSLQSPSKAIPYQGLNRKMKLLSATSEGRNLTDQNLILAERKIIQFGLKQL